MLIKSIIIVTAPGVKQRIVGNNGVEKIIIHPIMFTGDPFDHYCGFDKDGKMLFSVHPLCPCEVEYIN